MDPELLLLRATYTALALEPFAAVAGGVLVGALVIFAISAGTDEWYFSVLVGIAIVVCLSGPGVWIVYNTQLASKLHTPRLPIFHVVAFIIGCPIGVGAAFASLRRLGPALDDFKKKHTRRTRLERNRKTDVREINNFLPKPQPDYEPEKYFKSRSYFLGLGEEGRPVFWDQALPHVQVAGTTGAGKGVFLGMLAAQAIRRGAAVVYIDPKFDEWGPYVLFDAARKIDASYRFIDLRMTAPPQFNLFNGATAEEVEELFLAGFGLSDKGEAADFYRVADRRAAADASRIAGLKAHTPASLFREVQAEIEEEAPYFAGLLREMAAIPAVNARGGYDLARLVDEGGALYVVGSMRNAKVLRLQRMLLVRLIQLAERRDRRNESLRPVVAILDEFKTQMSRPAMEALQGARDKGMSVVMAHQSMSDLRDCPADMDPESVTGGVMENGKLKVIYRIQDPETAEWLAAKSGVIQVDDEVRSIRKNLALAETVDPDRAIRQSERFYVDQNMVLNLPERVAVVYGLGLPQFVQTAAMKVAKSAEAVSVVQAPAWDELGEIDDPIEMPADASDRAEESPI